MILDYEGFVRDVLEKENYRLDEPLRDFEIRGLAAMLIESRNSIDARDLLEQLKHDRDRGLSWFPA